LFELSTVLETKSRNEMLNEMALQYMTAIAEHDSKGLNCVGSEHLAQGAVSADSGAHFTTEHIPDVTMPTSFGLGPLAMDKITADDMRNEIMATSQMMARCNQCTKNIGTMSKFVTPCPYCGSRSFLIGDT